MPPFTDTPKHDVVVDVRAAAATTIIEASLPEPDIKLIEKSEAPLSPRGVASVDSDCQGCSSSGASDETQSGEGSTSWCTNVEPSHSVDEPIDRLKNLSQTLLKERSKKDIAEEAGEFYNQKGTMHFCLNNLSESENSYNRALHLYRCAYSQCRHKSSRCKNRRIKLLLAISATLSNISAVNLKRGKMGAAVAYLEQALKLQERVVNVRREQVGISAEMAHTLYNLGVTESSRGNYDKALKALGRAKNVFKSLYGPFHIELARVVDAIGTVHGLKGKSSYALDCHCDALRIKTAILHEHHPSVLRSMMDIANMYRRSGQLDKAEKMYRDRLAAQEDALQRALDPQYRRAIRADLAITMRWIAKVQRQRAYLDCVMPTIIEEQEIEKVEITDEGVEILLSA